MKTLVTKYRPLGLIARLVVGSVFVFSSVAKGLDPYGTVLKIGEYLQVMGLSWAEGIATPLAVGLVAVEMLIGSALIFGAAKRVVSRVAVAVCGVFTLFTLWVAIANPVADCGCFGDIVKLSNTQTFVKNVVLTLLAVVAMWGCEGEKSRLWSGVASLVATSGIVALSIYSLVWLPVVDRFPFGVGVNVREALAESEAEEMAQTFVVCRSLSSGEERRFGIEDSEWWNEQEWEFVRVESPAKEQVRVGIGDFRITMGSLDITESLLAVPMCRLLCVERVESLSTEEIAKFRRIAHECATKGDRVVVVTASSPTKTAAIFEGLEFYNMDATALRALLRAKAGVVTLKNGTIAQKLNLAVLP